MYVSVYVCIIKPLSDWLDVNLDFAELFLAPVVAQHVHMCSGGLFNVITSYSGAQIPSIHSSCKLGNSSFRFRSKIA